MTILYKDIISKMNSNQDFDTSLLNQLEESERKNVEKRINIEIHNGNILFYKYIPYLDDFDIRDLLTTGHCSKLEKRNLYELMTNIYIRKPTGNISEFLFTEANSNSADSDYAFECLKRIKNKIDKNLMLGVYVRHIENSKKNDGVNINQDFSKKDGIIYYRLNNGLLLKIDSNNYTGYKFNEEKQCWQENSIIFTDYQNGNLFGQEDMINDNYPTITESEYGRHL